MLASPKCRLQGISSPPEFQFDGWDEVQSGDWPCGWWTPVYETRERGLQEAYGWPTFVGDVHDANSQSHRWASGAALC